MQAAELKPALPAYDWDVTSKGEPRGYIDMARLNELWFHIGTACNLACPFCLEGSKPGDTRLGLMTLDDVRPYIDEAVSLGVKQFSFTGGEPFVAKEFPAILRYAADRLPCLVLTNGTLPLIRRMKDILTCKEATHPISFRISIDYLDEAQHDAGRGQGSFRQALEGIKALCMHGFDVSVARQRETGEDTEAADAAYRRFFQNTVDVEPGAIISFPDFQPPFSNGQAPEITESCMTDFHTEATRADFMCAYSRMIVKQNDDMRIYACTLVDDDLAYDLGSNLEGAISARVKLGHHRCYSCFAFGASCSQ